MAAVSFLPFQNKAGLPALRQDTRVQLLLVASDKSAAYIAAVRPAGPVRRLYHNDTGAGIDIG